MLTMLKRAASAVLTPAAGKVTVFVDDVGVPSYKDDAGNTQQMSWDPPKGYIDGLRMTWVSATQVSVASGSAYIPGLKRILEMPGSITKTPALTAIAWYHLYLYLNGTTPDIEITTTAPAAPYSGNARTKTGDNTRRYIGSLKTNAASGFWEFRQDSRYVKWLMLPGVGEGSTFRVLTNGLSTSPTTFSLSPGVPATATSAYVRLTNTAASGPARYDVPGRSGDYGVISVDPGQSVYLDFNCNSSQQMSYAYSAGVTGTNGAYCDVYGYALER